MIRMMLILVAVVTISWFSSVDAFRPGVVRTKARQQQQSTVSLSAAMMTTPPPPPMSQIQHGMPTTTASSIESSSSLNQGVQDYVMLTSKHQQSSSSSIMVSLKERKVPTAEEIAAKKRNFNLWLWGGGFVAPFLATFYYFGLKFWEK